MIFAPAKINLGLKITGRYANGYHRLESLFIPLALYDRLSVEKAARDEVVYTWPRWLSARARRQLAAGAQKSPLLLKTLAFVRGLGVAVPPLRVRVAKQIPSPSGMGGASSDAAALIRLLIGEGPLPCELSAVTTLGADIPYFIAHGLRGQSAFLTGVGHELQIAAQQNFSGFIAVPDFGFSTQQMFAQVRQLELPVATDMPNLALRLNEIPYSDELARGVKVVQNDFAAVARAVFPRQYLLLQQAMAKMARAARQFTLVDWLVGMTGSGPGLYCLTLNRLGVGPQRVITQVLQARLGHGWKVFRVSSHHSENIGP